MYEFCDVPRMIQSIKPERGCMSSVVFSSPDGIWWVPGKYYPKPGGAYIHPVMRLLNEIGGHARVLHTQLTTFASLVRLF